MLIKIVNKSFVRLVMQLMMQFIKAARLSYTQLFDFLARQTQNE